MTTSQTGAEGLNHGLFIANFPAIANAEMVVEYAVTAEEAGWDGVFLADTLLYPEEDWDPERAIGMFDPWIALSAIATRTDSITLGTWITPVPRRQPWQLARDLATLDHLSDGRVICGAGLGGPLDFNKFGRPYDMGKLGAKYDEALEVMAGLWSGEPFSYDGEFFSIDEAVLLPTPVQEPRIPIMIGGFWPNKRPIQRGARWDGLMPHLPSLLGGEGFHGEEATGTPEEEVRQMLDYYHGLTDDPGEVMLPIDFPEAPPGFVDTCAELGVTWTLTTSVDPSGEIPYNPTMERIQEGPPV